MNEKCPLIRPNDIYEGDSLDLLRCMDDESVDLVVTSPPYADKRKKSYGGVKADDYNEWFHPIAKEIKRVLKSTGSFVLNINDVVDKGVRHPYVYKLVTELAEDGWRWNDTFIWYKCLSGDTKLFVDCDGNYRLMSLQDIYNDKEKVSEFKIATQDKLGNEVWIRIKDIIYNGNRDLVKITTNSGRVMKCTPEHRFVARRSQLQIAPSGRKRNFRQIKLRSVSELTKKDYLYVNARLHTDLMEGDDDDYTDGFIVGFYLAEGSWIYRDYKPFKNNSLSIASQKSLVSRFGDVKPRGVHRRGVQFSCGVSDIERGHVQVLEHYYVNVNQYGNCVYVTSYGDIFELVKTYVTGATCDTKYLLDNAFNRSKKFIKGILDGFLSGDGYYDERSKRWRACIKPNRLLKDQIMLMCRIMNYDFRFFSSVRKVKNKDNGKIYTAMDFSIRKGKGKYRQTQFDMFADKIKEIKCIGSSDVFDIQVEILYRGIGNNQYKKSTMESKLSYNEIYNNLYFLGNGIWTHNSNPIPRVVHYRFKDGFEYIYHFTKEKDFKRDMKAVKIPMSKSTLKGIESAKKRDDYHTRTFRPSGMNWKTSNLEKLDGMAFPSNVINAAVSPNKTVHTAVFPKKIPEFFISFLTEPGDVVLDPFSGSGTTSVVAKEKCRNFIGLDRKGEYVDISRERLEGIDNSHCKVD